MLPTRRSGFTLVELLIVLVIMTITLGLLSRLLASTASIGPIHRETSRAVEAARDVIEQMHNMPFREVFARYNDDPSDDPDGPGTAPGNRFSVDGLEPQVGDPLGLEGEVVFPAVDGQLREDVTDSSLGFPRDINADGVVDDEDHASDCIVLPLVVRIRWTGHSGDRSFEMFTMLADR